MVKVDQLKDYLHQKGLTRSQQLLFCLGAEPREPRSVAEIKALALGAGLRRIKDWNVSGILSQMKGVAVRTNIGWELTASGRKELASLLAGRENTPIFASASVLRSALPKISTAAARAFASEAVACLEHGLLRAAVVLSWVGAVAILYERVREKHLAAFNAEAQRRDPKWKTANNSDELARMREADFLQVLEAISVLGRNTKLEIEACLKLRNACGHPSSLSIGEHRVASHLEILVLNVYTPFAG